MDKYLLQILHDVNTIIIPGLGALTITNAKTGEMMFMSYLKYDDGKLAAYISEKEGMPENDAKNLIAKYVRDIQTKLDQGHSYDMFQFGRFLKNKDGDVDFESWASMTDQEKASESLAESPVVEETIVILPETTEEIVVTVPEETAPQPVAELVEIKAEVEPAPEVTLTPEFQGIEQTEEPETTAIDAFEDLTVLPVSEPVSLDAILEKSEEKIEENETGKTEPIALATQDEGKVQVENIYIPPVEKPAETIVPPAEEIVAQPEAEKAKPDPKEPKPKKKRGAGFWILIVLIILLLGGGTTTVFFYDQVKTYLPFLESKRAEAEKKKDTISAEKLNEAAESLEAAENERVAAEQDGTATPESSVIAPETDNPVAPIVEAPVEKPVAPVKSQPAATNNNNGDKNYHVIGGAFTEKGNADRYAEKLKSGGNNSVIVGRFDNLYLVSIDSYSSKQEAQNALRGFESITGKAWVFKWP